MFHMTTLYQKKINFEGVSSIGSTGYFHNNVQTNLIPDSISYGNRKFEGWEEMKNSTKYIFN